MTRPIPIVVALVQLLLLASCQPPNGSQSSQGQGKPVAVLGDTVADFGPSAMVIHHARNGDYWVGSYEEGAFRYDGKVVLRYDTSDGLAGPRVNEIREDAAGRMYFNTTGGVSRWDGRSFETLPTELRLSESEPWRSGPEDLWFKPDEGHHGPLRYDGAWLHEMRFPRHYMEAEYNKTSGNHPWSPYDLYSIYKDPQGHTWFGTGNLGLCRWDGEQLAWMYEDDLQFTPNGGSFGIRAVLQDREGYYWINHTKYRYRIEEAGMTGEVPMRDGNRLLRYTRAPGITGLKLPDGQDHFYFLSILQAGNGDLWMATFEQGIWRYDGKEAKQYPVQDGGKDYTAYCIMEDRKGGLWVGTHEGGPFRWDGQGFVRFRP